MQSYEGDNRSDQRDDKHEDRQKKTSLDNRNPSIGKRNIHQPEAITTRNQSKHTDQHSDHQNNFRFHKSKNHEPLIYCGLALAFFANFSHGCNFQGCISYTKTPDFTAGSFVTIAFASASFETSNRTAPPAS